MAKLVHLSDLHFGAHDPRLVAAVETRIGETKPDLVVISGDFTQRARTSQFKQAASLLARLEQQGYDVLAVPGNHDIPLYDVLRRFMSPLRRYRRYIAKDIYPYRDLDDAEVLGINTARSLTFKDGRINEEQVAHVRTIFGTQPADKVRILVTHHPMFALPVGDGPELGKAVGRQKMALEAVSDAGVDLLLAGHNHRASTGNAEDIVAGAGQVLVVQAGTATSLRIRDEEQSFNIIDVSGQGEVVITVQAWAGDGFSSQNAQRFVRREGLWETAQGKVVEQVATA
nr:metallophosphoesterase [uncultured Sphingomonas sp.]